MTSTPSIFNFDSTAIRVIMDEDSQPMFVGKDVCEALGYSDPTNAMKQHCRGVVKRHPIIDNLGRPQEVRVLYEPDVYRLIVNCRLPAAENFERLVFEEILPSIRKTGQYSINQQPRISLVPAAPEFDAALTIARLVGLNGNQAILSANHAVKKIMNINCLDIIGQPALICEKQEVHLTASDIAKKLGVSSGARINNAFEKLGIIESFRDHKNRKRWKITSEGNSFALLKDTGKRSSDGMVQQLFFNESAVGLLDKSEI